MPPKPPPHPTTPTPLPQRTNLTAIRRTAAASHHAQGDTLPREDERFRNLSPRHPEYCTCVECVAKRRDNGGSNADGPNPLRAVGGLVGKLTGKGAKASKAGKGKGKRRGQSGGGGKARGRSPVIGEEVRKHKRNCQCATCTLLKSI